MLIGGVQELTTLDFPGRLAAVVFTLGCNSAAGIAIIRNLWTKNRSRNSQRQYSGRNIFQSFWKKKRPTGGCASAEASRPYSRIFWNSPGR